MLLDGADGGGEGEIGGFAGGDRVVGLEAEGESDLFELADAKGEVGGWADEDGVVEREGGVE